MTLYLMLTHFSMLVLGMELKDSKPIDMPENSDLMFTVDESKLFKDELKIICDSFNIICDSKNKNIENVIFDYCNNSIRFEMEFKGTQPNDFNDSFKKLSKMESKELEFFNKILNIKKTDILSLFEAVKIRINAYNLELIKMFESKKERCAVTKIKNVVNQCDECIGYIRESNKLIERLTSTINHENGTGLSKCITDFITDLYCGKGLINMNPPVMDAYEYNNYMLLLSLCKLNKIISDKKIGVNPLEKDYDTKIKNIIKDLSVETFMFFVHNDRDIIDKMKENITPANICFWNECRILELYTPEYILDINYNGLYQEILYVITPDDSEEIIYDNPKEDLKILNTYKEIISAIIKNDYYYGENNDGYKKLFEQLYNLIEKIEAANQLA